jgi:hypothetical protein
MEGYGGKWYVSPLLRHTNKAQRLIIVPVVWKLTNYTNGFSANIMRLDPFRNDEKWREAVRGWAGKTRERR